VEINLSSLQEDQCIERWYQLGWVPGQLRKAPRGEVQIRLLLSSATEKLSPEYDWMLESFDFAQLQEEIDSCKSKMSSDDPSRFSAVEKVTHMVIRILFGMVCWCFC